MINGLNEETLTKILAVFEGHSRVDEVILYGSRAKGNFKNGSDVDLAVKGEELTLTDLYTIHSALDELSLAYTFDVSLYARIQNTDLIEHVDRVGVVIYQRH
jgi:predicted nucleotidyltransferase